MQHGLVQSQERSIHRVQRATVAVRRMELLVQKLTKLNCVLRLGEPVGAHAADGVDGTREPCMCQAG